MMLPGEAVSRIQKGNLAKIFVNTTKITSIFSTMARVFIFTVLFLDDFDLKSFFFHTDKSRIFNIYQSRNNFNIENLMKAQKREINQKSVWKIWEK